VEPLVEEAEDSSENFEPLIIDDIPFPRVASQRIRAMSVEARAEWDAARFKCKTDQLYLSDVLGLDLVENPASRVVQHILEETARDSDGRTRSSGQAADDPLASRSRKNRLQPRRDGTIILNYPNARLCFLTGGDHLANYNWLREAGVRETEAPVFGIVSRILSDQPPEQKNSRVDRHTGRTWNPTRVYGSMSYKHSLCGTDVHD